MRKSPTAEQVITHYHLLSQLGVGGMGEVYLAEDTRLGRKVALKLLPAEFTQDAERVRRFEREARAASALNHPNILTIYEVGQAEGRHFIAAEFIEGHTLRHRLKQAHVPLSESLEIAIQVANALHAAHAVGITHRDIKPENIMLRPDGYVKVLDFGLAKLTEKNAKAKEDAALLAHMTAPGVLMGTVSYMSPEQARGWRVDARSDIFSLGIVLYEMLTGHLPFAGPTMTDTLAAILQSEPPPLTRYVPNPPAELEQSLTSALRKDREARCPTIKRLLGELKQIKSQLEFEAQLARVSQSNPGIFNSEAITLAMTQESLSRVGRTTRATTRRPRVRKVIDSLAILPLLNASADPDMEYLSDGITESIINSLAQLPRLRVVPASTVFRYKGQKVDPQEIGQELGVRAVLSGRVQQHGKTLIIKAELIDIAHESQLWGEQYRKQWTDIFTLQEEISREISEKLRLRLTGEEKKKLVKRYTENTDAYHLYLKGRYYTHKRTPDWIKKGIEHFQQAIDLDPNYAMAYAGLADAYAFMGSSTGGHAPRETYPMAKTAALKALELDDTLGEAHCSLGFFRLLFDWDFAAAEREYKRAIELSPNYANAHDGYGFYLKSTGQHEAAIRECKLAQQLDPLSPFTTLSLGWAYYFARDFDQSLAQGRKVLELDPNLGFAYWHVGMGYRQKGRYEEAIVALRKAVNLAGGSPNFIAHLGHAYAVAGKQREARQMLAQIERLAKRQYVSSYYLAMIQLGLGNLKETFAALEQAYEERAGFLAFLKVEPMLDPLRGDARFVDLVRRVGLTS
jgi:eukaryotic-like serine/threonine-protein kinase